MAQVGFTFLSLPFLLKTLQDGKAEERGSLLLWAH